MKTLVVHSFYCRVLASHEQQLHIRTIYRSFIASLVLLIMVAAVDASSVSIDEGGIVYTGSDGQVVHLTDSGYDFAPVLSPDGARAAFIRSFRTPEDDFHGYTNCSIWIVDVTGDNLRCLATGRTGSPDAPLGLSDFNTLIYSPDGRDLFFHSQPWATECALHAINLETGELRYIAPGELKRVVPRGIYANHLLVQQHRYFLGGGSYDWVWLLTPDGQEVGPVTDGEDTHGADPFFGFWELYVE